MVNSQPTVSRYPIIVGNNTNRSGIYYGNSITSSSFFSGNTPTTVVTTVPNPISRMNPSYSSSSIIGTNIEDTRKNYLPPSVSSNTYASTGDIPGNNTIIPLMTTTVPPSTATKRKRAITEEEDNDEDENEEDKESFSLPSSSSSKHRKNDNNNVGPSTGSLSSVSIPTTTTVKPVIHPRRSNLIISSLRNLLTYTMGSSTVSDEPKNRHESILSSSISSSLPSVSTHHPVSLTTVQSPADQLKEQADYVREIMENGTEESSNPNDVSLIDALYGKSMTKPKETLSAASIQSQTRVRRRVDDEHTTKIETRTGNEETSVSTGAKQLTEQQLNSLAKGYSTQEPLSKSSGISLTSTTNTLPSNGKLYPSVHTEEQTNIMLPSAGKSTLGIPKSTEPNASILSSLSSSTSAISSSGGTLLTDVPKRTSSSYGVPEFLQSKVKLGTSISSSGIQSSNRAGMRTLSVPTRTSSLKPVMTSAGTDTHVDNNNNDQISYDNEEEEEDHFTGTGIGRKRIRQPATVSKNLRIEDIDNDEETLVSSSGSEKRKRNNVTKGGIVMIHDDTPTDGEDKKRLLVTRSVQTSSILYMPSSYAYDNRIKVRRVTPSIGMMSSLLTSSAVPSIKNSVADTTVTTGNTVPPRVGGFGGGFKRNGSSGDRVMSGEEAPPLDSSLPLPTTALRTIHKAGETENLTKKEDTKPVASLLPPSTVSTSKPSIPLFTTTIQKSTTLSNLAEVAASVTSTETEGKGSNKPESDAPTTEDVLPKPKTSLSFGKTSIIKPTTTGSDVPTTDTSTVNVVVPSTLSTAKSTDETTVSVSETTEVPRKSFSFGRVLSSSQSSSSSTTTAPTVAVNSAPAEATVHISSVSSSTTIAKPLKGFATFQAKIPATTPPSTTSSSGASSTTTDGLPRTNSGTKTINFDGGNPPSSDTGLGGFKFGKRTATETSTNSSNGTSTNTNDNPAAERVSSNISNASVGNTGTTGSAKFAFGAGRQSSTNNSSSGNTNDVTENGSSNNGGGGEIKKTFGFGNNRTASISTSNSSSSNTTVVPPPSTGTFGIRTFSSGGTTGAPSFGTFGTTTVGGSSSSSGGFGGGFGKFGGGTNNGSGSSSSSMSGSSSNLGGMFSSRTMSAPSTSGSGASFALGATTSKSHKGTTAKRPMKK